MHVHKLLNPFGKGNWKDLAAELSVPYLDIRTYEANAETSAECMLSAWGTSNQATVDKLHAALFRIGREDVARYLEESVSNLSVASNNDKVSLV